MSSVAPAPTVQTRSTSKVSCNSAPPWEARAKTDDQRNHKGTEGDGDSLKIQYNGQMLRRVKVPPLELQESIVNELRKKRIEVPTTQVIHLKKTRREGLGSHFGGRKA